MNESVNDQPHCTDEKIISVIAAQLAAEYLDEISREQWRWFARAVWNRRQTVCRVRDKALKADLVSELVRQREAAWAGVLQWDWFWYCFAVKLSSAYKAKFPAELPERYAPYWWCMRNDGEGAQS